MKTFFLFVSGIIGMISILFGVSLFVGNNVSADISFDTQVETQWYGSSKPFALVSATPEPTPIPVGIVVNITQTRESH